MATKWSIVGSGRVCNDFVTCLQSLPPTEHQLVAVADLNLENAKKFAEKFSIPKAYGNYDDLAKDPDFDIAYIGVVHPFHFEASEIMLNGNKHVLCEKPFCMTLEETEKLIVLAQKKKRFLMEGMWSRCLPIYEKLREELAEGSIGMPNLIQTCYFHPGLGDDRFVKYGLGGGTVLDPGVYPFQLITLIFGTEKPEKITVEGHLNEEGVEEVALITLLYSKERVATIALNYRTIFYSHALIAGTKGIIQIPNPMNSPTSLETPGHRYEIPMPAIDGVFLYVNTTGFIYEINHVRECLQKGLLESPLIPLEETKSISYLITEVRRRLGCKE